MPRLKKPISLRPEGRRLTAFRARGGNGRRAELHDEHGRDVFLAA